LDFLSVFEVGGRQHPVSVMCTFRVREHFEVAENDLSRSLSGFGITATYALTIVQFEGSAHDALAQIETEEF